MKTLYLFFIFQILFVAICVPQAGKIPVFSISSLPPVGVLLDNGWKYQAGDNREWARPDYNDKQWKTIEPSKDIRDIPEIWKTNIGWLRLHLNVDSIVAEKHLNFLIDQTGASEIFLNGQFIGRFGTISSNERHIQAVTPVIGSFIPFPIHKHGEQVLAVRFAIQKNISYINFYGRPNVAFVPRVMETNTISTYIHSDNVVYFEFTRVGLFLILAVIHLALLFHNPAQKANLYFFLYASIFGLAALIGGVTYRHTDLASSRMIFLIGVLLALFLSAMFFLLAVYKTFEQRVGMVFWVLVTASFIPFILSFYNYHSSFWATNLLIFLTNLEAIRITVQAEKAKRRGAKIVIAGSICYLIFIILANLFALGYMPAGPGWIYGNIAYNLAFLSLPIAISVFLALESSYASRLLKEKLEEVQLLSQQALAQEQEKHEILAQQNELLENRVNERTHELSEQKNDLQNTLIKLKKTQSQLIQSEKMASLGELTAGIAHEIQNPLNFVNNFSDVNTELVEELQYELKAGNSQDALSISNEIKENEQKINHHGKRADAIVKGMLQHSRVSTGKKEPTDINALAEEYLRLAYQGQRAKDKSFNVKLITSFDPTVEKINLVPQDIGRVLLNLYNNAFYAAPLPSDGGFKDPDYKHAPTVWVSTKKEGDKIVIEVMDNGPGIPSNIIDKIFQPFFTTKPTGQGTGLGLSLSYDIVKAHGGELRVETQEGEGSEFIIKLPVG